MNQKIMDDKRLWMKTNNGFPLKWMSQCMTKDNGWHNIMVTKDNGWHNIMVTKDNGCHNVWQKIMDDII